MLHVRIVAPQASCDAVVRSLDGDPTVTSLVIVRDVGAGAQSDLVEFDVARENAESVLAGLRRLGVEESGSVSIHAPDSVFSVAADRAEQAAPGHPDDGVIWRQLEARSIEDSRLSTSFLVFLALATLIAGVGRYLDQPILIIGAMVVGPEFAPIAAICLSLARRRPDIGRAAISTLAIGFTLATMTALVFWLVAGAVGAVDRQAAVSGELTEFIIQPDGWSVVIALLAGVAGVLSMTASKSSTLVGVFISVTTVPAIGTLALTASVGAWGEAASSLLQLGVNLAGMILAGTATMLIQRAVWRLAPSLRRRLMYSNHLIDPAGRSAGRTRRPRPPGGSRGPR